MRRHKAAAAQRSDSGPLHFLSTVSSRAEVAVLQGDDKQGAEDSVEEVQHYLRQHEVRGFDGSIDLSTRH